MRSVFPPFVYHETGELLNDNRFLRNTQVMNALYRAAITIFNRIRRNWPFIALVLHKTDIFPSKIARPMQFI